MNDRIPYLHVTDSKISVDSSLVRNFIETVRNDRHSKHVDSGANIKYFVSSFKILLEEVYGVPPSEEPQFKAFWEKVYERAKRYHTSHSSGFHSLSQMEDDARLEQDLNELIQEYHHILRSDVETAPHPTISKLQTHFRSEGMRGL